MNTEQILSNFLQATTEFCQLDDPIECQKRLNIAIDNTLKEIIDWQTPSELIEMEDCYE